MSTKASLARGLQACLGNQDMANAFSDFTVCIEDTSFHCHRFILNACSGYFQALFRSNMKECQENLVKLNDIPKNVFKIIIDSLYKGIDGLTEENVFEVWDATLKLQIGYLSAECEQFVIKTMSVKNCFIFYESATLNSSDRVVSFFFKFMCENFEVLKQSDDFLKLSASDYYRIIESEDLGANSEESVVESILDWAGYIPQNATPYAETQAEDRPQYMSHLLSAARLCLVSPACLQNLLKHDLVLSCRDAHNMIIDAVNYNMCVEYRHDAWPDAALHRRLSAMKHAMVFFDGDKLMAYLLNTGERHVCAHLPEFRMPVVTGFDNVLYADNYSSLKMYTRDNTWQCIIQSHSHRVRGGNNHILVPHGSYIYCYDVLELALKRYNCSHGNLRKWETCAVGGMAAESLVRYKQFILMFHTENNAVTTGCFDTATGRFVTLSPDNPMDGPSDFMASFTYHKDVFLLQRNGNLRKIISTDSSPVDFQFVSKLWNFDCEIYGAVCYRKELFVLGGNEFEDVTNVPCVTSVPGIFETLKTVRIKSDTKCVPMVIPMTDVRLFGWWEDL